MLRTLASSSGWLFAGALVALSSAATSLGGCTGATSSVPESGGYGGTGGTGFGGTGFGGTGGTGGSGGTSAAGPMLEFTMQEPMQEPLSLLRGEQHTLEVQAWPPGEFVVRFALLPGPELTPPGDAALSATDLTTNSDGRVSVILTAPSAPTTFDVRASTSGGGYALRRVTVAKTGKADLRVEADYSGERAGSTTRWFATAVPNQTCSMLLGGDLDDELDWTSAADGVVDLRDVPADVQLAVAIRAEHFARGCTTVPGAVEGMNNHVLVPVSNVPLQLTESEVSVSFDLAMFQDAFQTAVEPSIVAALAQVPSDGDDVSALLARMQSESGDDEPSFRNARNAGGWDAAVRTSLGADAATALRSPLERWMRLGLANTSAGRFIGTLGAEGDDPEGALLTLETVAGLPPEALGFSDENDATWYSSSPADDVFFGTTLAVDPSLLLLGGAVAPARTEVDGSGTIAQALSAVLSCDAVATELVARGAAASVSYVGCDLDCTRSLCESALATLVGELEEREETDPSSLELAAAAAAKVGPDAELVGLEGTWVGSLVNEDETTPVGGVVLAPAP